MKTPTFFAFTLRAILLPPEPDAGLWSSTHAWWCQFALTRPGGIERRARDTMGLVRHQAYLMPVREPGTLGLSPVPALPVDPAAPTVEADGGQGTCADMAGLGSEG